MEEVEDYHPLCVVDVNGKECTTRKMLICNGNFATDKSIAKQ